jgi:FtsP/CotA-like multicopper oxidase with cupredoxin domain
MTMESTSRSPAQNGDADTATVSPDTVDLAAPLAATTELTKFLDPLRIPPVIKVAEGSEVRRLKITMKTTYVRLHSELPRTRVWAYDGHFPGPTIDVRRGQKLRVTWRNAISGEFPLTAVAVDVQNATADPGRDGAEPLAEVAALPAWLVTHVHGARTGGGNDGWTENAVLRGEAQLAEYLNDQQATTLWYHDHAMAITALNVQTGLAGMYLIRDDEEDALQLPSGKYEVPLIICDRNLDTTTDGNLTGGLLYKRTIVQTEPMQIKLPFTGPFTLVNGVIWPHLRVDARWYRFRMLNSSNSRPYTFELRDENGEPVRGALHQIGSDSGLLPAPAHLDHLTLEPGERGDVLIDFSSFRGTSLSLVNTLAPPIPATAPNPDVMQFRVRARAVSDEFTLPSTLSPSFVRLTHDNLPEHAHRWLVLAAVDGRHAEMWEMVEIDEAPADLPLDGIVQVQLQNGDPKTLQRVTREFKDATAFYVEHGAWEQWRFLNVSAIPHPIHIHLIGFQAISRDMFDVASFDTAVGGTSAPVTFTGPGTLEPGEQAWKDTIRVGGGELVSIVGEFTGGTGRYVHHCHILEHEDEGMMRTFVVMPEAVMAIDPHMDHGPSHSHSSGNSSDPEATR